MHPSGPSSGKQVELNYLQNQVQIPVHSIQDPSKPSFSLPFQVHHSTYFSPMNDLSSSPDYSLHFI